jgi:hypothetical protein
LKQGGTVRAQAIGRLTVRVLNDLHEMEATISLTGRRKTGSGSSAGRRESLQESWMGRSKAYGRRKPRRRMRAGQKDTNAAIVRVCPCGDAQGIVKRAQCVKLAPMMVPHLETGFPSHEKRRGVSTTNAFRYYNIEHAYLQR